MRRHHLLLVPVWAMASMPIPVLAQTANPAATSGKPGSAHSKVVVSTPSPGFFEPPDIGIPTPMSGNSLAAPSISLNPVQAGIAPTTSSMTTPPMGAAHLDAPLPATQPSAMATPAVTPPTPLTMPPMDPMSAGAPTFTTGADVAREVARMKTDKDAQAAARHAQPLGHLDGKVDPKARLPGGASGAERMLPDKLGGPDRAVQATSAPTTEVVRTPLRTPGFDGAGCKPGGDIAQLLSPACLDSLRDNLRAPGGGLAPSAPTQATPSAQSTQCVLVIYNTSGVAGAPASFTTSGVEQCIATASSLSYGVPGMSNITALDPSWGGMVAVSCKRPGDGRTISCEAHN